MASYSEQMAFCNALNNSSDYALLGPLSVAS